MLPARADGGAWPTVARARRHRPGGGARAAADGGGLSACTAGRRAPRRSCPSSTWRRRTCRRATRGRRPIGSPSASPRAAPSSAALEPLGGGGELMRAAAPGARRPTGGRSAWWSRATCSRASSPSARAHDARLRGLHAAARAEAAADRRVPVVLPDAHADDHGGRDVDRACTSPSGSPGPCRCCRRPRARSAPVTSITGSSRRRADEFGSLVEAFNSMAGELAASRQQLEQSTHDLQRKHLEVEGRRRYIETMLERIATGVISVDAAGLVTTDQPSAARLLGLDPTRPAARRTTCSARAISHRSSTLLHKVLRGRAEPPAQEIALDARRIARSTWPRWPAPCTASRRRDGGRRARVRRRDAADPVAEGRGLARGGAAAGARDQEPADADPAVGRAPAPALRPAPPADAGAGGRVHAARSWPRSSR